MLQILKAQLKEAELNWSAKSHEIKVVQNDIANGVDTWKTPSFLFGELNFYSGQINALKTVIELLEGKDETCTQCEGKADKLSDDGYCPPCFDQQEEEERLQEEVNA